MRYTAAALALLALGMAACRRGALADFLREHGAAPAAKTAPEQLLTGVDCPDGLARCIGGEVEISHVKRVPRPCPPTSKPEECVCPWEGIDTCPSGCASEATEIVVDPAHAAGRLCAPDPAHPVARLATGVAVPAGVCDAEGYRCVASLVVSCADDPDASARARVIAACVHGCVREGETLGEEEAPPESITRILCAR